jgi:hypothetical protein
MGEISINVNAHTATINRKNKISEAEYETETTLEMSVKRRIKCLIEEKINAIKTHSGLLSRLDRKTSDSRWKIWD